MVREALVAQLRSLPLPGGRTLRLPPSMAEHFSAHGGCGAWLRWWVLILAGSWAHLAVTNVAFVASATWPVWLAFGVPLAALVAPAALVAWKVPAARRGSWRWPILWATAGVVNPVIAIGWLVFGEAWLFRRGWVLQGRLGFDLSHARATR